MSAAVDHLVVAADTLAQGVAWCEEMLGVSPGPGGRHALMGTHNRLLKISSSAYPMAYLEIIAIDPEAPPPQRTRWFGLDDPGLQARLKQSPRLMHWVARTEMLDMHRWGLVALGLNPGEPVSATRDTPAGRLSWQILLRTNGTLDCAGALPTLIEWQGPHPSAQMPDSGLQLVSVELSGVPPKALEVLRLRGVSLAAQAGPALRARLTGARGDVWLSSD